jgi:cytochrome P450
MEGRVALTARMKRVTVIELGDNPLVWRNSLVLRGLSSLPIRFNPT